MWKLRLKKTLYILFAASFFLLAGCQSETNKQEPKPQQVKTQILHKQDNGIAFSQESGVYHTPELKVRMKAPAGYTIAYTTNGTKPMVKDASGKAEVEVTLNGGMSGYLMDHKKLMLTPEFYNSVLYESNELPVGVVLNASLVDGKGAVVKEPRTMVYFLMQDKLADRFPNCTVISITTDPKNLLDYKTGIMAPGAIYDAWKQTDAGKKIIADQEWWKAETNSSQHGKKGNRPLNWTPVCGSGEVCPGDRTRSPLRCISGIPTDRKRCIFRSLIKKRIISGSACGTAATTPNIRSLRI